MAISIRIKHIRRTRADVHAIHVYMHLKGTKEKHKRETLYTFIAILHKRFFLCFLIFCFLLLVVVYAEITTPYIRYTFGLFKMSLVLCFCLYFLPSFFFSFLNTGIDHITHISAMRSKFNALKRTFCICSTRTHFNKLMYFNIIVFFFAVAILVVLFSFFPVLFFLHFLFCSLNKTKQYSVDT